MYFLNIFMGFPFDDSRVPFDDHCTFCDSLYVLKYFYIFKIKIYKNIEKK